MDKKLLDYDPLTGTSQYIYYDDLTDETHIHTIQDSAHLNAEIEASRDLQKDADYTKQGLKNDMVHYAHIPDELLMKWHGEGIDIKDRKTLFKMVNKPEYAYLKTTHLVHR